MPARPTSRLDLHLVPPGSGPSAADASRALRDAWREDGWLAGDGPGPKELVAGGFRSVRVDEPGRAVLYANGVGGFHVRCPACGAGLAREFRPFDLTICPCGARSAWDALDARPPLAVGWASLVIADAQDADVRAPLPAGWRVVGRRV